MDMASHKIWSVKLSPGMPLVIKPQQDIKLTNVAFDHHLNDCFGRTSIKLTFFEDGKKVIPGGGGGEYNDHETVLCSLIGGKVEQSHILDIVLKHRGEYILEAIGANDVYVTGVVDAGVGVSSASCMTKSMKGQMYREPTQRPASSRVNISGFGLPLASNHRAISGPASEAVKASTDSRPVPTSTAHLGLAAVQPKSRLKSSKCSRHETKAEDGADSSAEFPEKVIVTDKIVGTGDVVMKKSLVECWFTVRLADGKEVYRVSSGVPKTFTVGMGQVIEGWDQNIEGMRVGGNRQLIIPPRFAFGEAGTTNIPPNSVVFIDFTLVDIADVP